MCLPIFSIGLHSWHSLAPLVSNSCVITPSRCLGFDGTPPFHLFIHDAPLLSVYDQVQSYLFSPQAMLIAALCITLLLLWASQRAASLSVKPGFFVCLFQLQQLSSELIFPSKMYSHSLKLISNHNFYAAFFLAFNLCTIQRWFLEYCHIFWLLLTMTPEPAISYDKKKGDFLHSTVPFWPCHQAPPKLNNSPSATPWFILAATFFTSSLTFIKKVYISARYPTTVMPQR